MFPLQPQQDLNDDDPGSLARRLPPPVIVILCDRQPALNVRSSTSVLQQAYSTPIPIADLTSTLAGITPDTTVYEPSAGHGALLVGADPAQVSANELNPGRAADLRAQGYTVTEWEAAEYQPERLHDVVNVLLIFRDAL